MVDAVTALADRLMILLACSDIFIAQGEPITGEQVQRSLMRSISALRVLQEELTSIEIFERIVTTELDGIASKPRGM